MLSLSLLAWGKRDPSLGNTEELRTRGVLARCCEESNMLGVGLEGRELKDWIVTPNFKGTATNTVALIRL